MANPLLIVSASALALIGVFTGYNFVTAQLENGLIKEEGLRLSEPLMVSAFTAAVGTKGPRIKAENSIVVQRAKDFPLVRDSAWEGIAGKNASCNQFALELRDTTHKIAYAFGATGIYSEKELEYAARVAKVATGVLAQSAFEIASKSPETRSKLDEICTKATVSLAEFYAEASRRVSRKLQGPALAADSLGGQTSLVMGESFAAFFRAYHYTKN